MRKSKMCMLIIWGPIYKYGSTVIPAWISYHMPSQVWGGITYPTNFNGCNGYTVEGVIRGSSLYLIR